MAKYDVVVVGAGPAGAGTAIGAAKSGLKTLMIERGRWPGEKSRAVCAMFRSFGNELFPGLEDLIPKDKLLWNIHNFNLAFEYCLYKRGGFAMFRALQPDGPETKHPHGMYITYRNQWDRWFAGLAVDEGVELMTSTLVVDVLRDDHGTITGVITDKGEKIDGTITIAADGTNSIVARKAGLRPKYQPKDVVVYAQMVYELGPDAPSREPAIVSTYDFVETELVDAEEVGPGNAWTYYIVQSNGKRYLRIGAGSMTQPGSKMRCYMRTNTWYLIQRIGQHPVYKQYIDNGKLVYLDGQIAPATCDLGSYGPTYGDGILVVGDAGIGTVWQGFGVFPAWESAIIAADVAKKAIDKGDVSKAVLKEYEDKWKQRPWFADAAHEPWIHAKWGADDGFGPFIRGLTKATPEVEPRPGYGYMDAHEDYLKDVLVPTLSNMPNMWPPGAKPLPPVDPAPDPKESATLLEPEKEWVGKNLSDKIKECVTFVPATSQYISIDDTKCIGCGLCYKHCLGGVFDLDEKAGKAVASRIETCMECGICYMICPSDAIKWSYPEGGTGFVFSAPGVSYWDEETDVISTGGRPVPPSQQK